MKENNLNQIFTFSVTELSQISKNKYEISSEGSLTGIESHKNFFKDYYIKANDIKIDELEIEKNIKLNFKISKHDSIFKSFNLNNNINSINIDSNNIESLNQQNNNNLYSNIQISGKIDCIDHKNRKIIELKTINLRKFFNYLVLKNEINLVNKLKTKTILEKKHIEIDISSYNKNNNNNNNSNNNNNNYTIDYVKILETYLLKKENGFNLKNNDFLINFKFQLFLYGYIFHKINKYKKIYKLELILFDPTINKMISIIYKPDYRKILPYLKKRISFLYKIKEFEQTKFYKKLKFAYSKKNKIQTYILKNLINNKNKYQFIEAPFGIGKTTITLYSILKKYGSNVPKIIYLTSKNIQKQQIYKEGRKYNLNCLIIQSIESTCLLHLPYCIHSQCKYFQNDISNIDIFEFNKLINNNPNDEGNFNNNSNTINSHYGNNNNFLNLNANSNFCIVPYTNFYYKYYDLIIADYNFLFYNNLSSINTISSNGFIIVIDEFHSFLKRVKDFFTIKLNQKEIEKTISSIYSYFPDFPQNLLNTLFKNNFFTFDAEYNSFDEENFNIDFETLTDSLNKAFYFFTNFVDDNLINIYKKNILPLLRKIETITLLSKFEFKSATYTNLNKVITYKKLKNLFNYLTKSAKTIIGVSATLSPKNQIFEIADENEIDIISLNEKKEIKVIIKKGIETTHKKRKYYYTKITDFIINNSQNNGTYLIFLPSYKFISEISIFFYGLDINKIIFNNKEKNYSDINSIEDNIENLVKNRFEINSDYKENNKDTLKPEFIRKKIKNDKRNYIFIPYNSIFSEGINFNMPITSIFCVGLPYAVPEEKYITHYYILKEDDKNPFEILSLFPAINEILQVSGRIGRKYQKNNFSKNSANLNDEEQTIYFIGNDFSKQPVYENIENYYKNIYIEE